MRSDEMSPAEHPLYPLRYGGISAGLFCVICILPPGPHRGGVWEVGKRSATLNSASRKGGEAGYTQVISHHAYSRNLTNGLFR